MASKSRYLMAAFFGGGTAVLGLLSDSGSVKQWLNRQRIFLYDKVKCESKENLSCTKLQPMREKTGHVQSTISDSAQQAIIEQARSLIQRYKEEQGCPGLMITVSVDGDKVWSEGFGYADIENNVKCQPSTVMRIASISKPLTATAIMKLLEEGKLNLDDPVQKYVPSFPAKVINSKECTITIRHLLSHLAGIRHYKKRSDKTNKENGLKDEAKGTRLNEAQDYGPEYYIKECYDSVEKSLSLFKDDPLVHEPGSKYLYTTFGWTLLSAVIETASKQNFLKYMNGLFEELDMNHTSAELHDKLIYGRGRFYIRDRKGRLHNTPYVDNSYKFAGGGFLSTTEDLVKFGNAMLYSSQVADVKPNTAGLLPGVLSPKTMAESWEIVKNTEGKACKKCGYGLGWMIFPNKHEHGYCRNESKTIFHTGGAVGASSLLLISPQSINDVKEASNGSEVCLPPKGVVVAIIVNISKIDLLHTGLKMAKLFQDFKDV